MSPVNVAIVAGALIVLGKWARDKAPNIDNAVGIAGIAIGLSVLEQMNEELSAAFGTLILVSLAVVHLPTIAKAAGFSK